MKQERIYDSYLSRENTNCLKGILAILIILHHCYLYSGINFGKILNLIFDFFGFLSVGAFFFLSAYGLAKQYLLRKDEYLKYFLRNRVLSTYLVYLFM